MLPFILCWAVTADKIQGMTLEKALIDVGKKNLAQVHRSVAVTRLRSIVCLTISVFEEKIDKMSKLIPRSRKITAKSRRTTQAKPGIAIDSWTIMSCSLALSSIF